jgi:hypothetical protein
MRLAVVLSVLTMAPLCPAAEIPAGAHVLLRLVNSVSTRTAREGDYVYMKTATPIVAAGQVIVPVDCYVQGVVTRVQRAGRVTGRAELGVRIETLTLSTGKVVKVAPHLSSVDSDGTDQRVENRENQVEQGGTKGEDAARIAATSGTGAAIGGLADRSLKGAGIGAGAGGAVGLATVLLSRGREVELKQGSTVDVIFDRAVPME